MPTPLNPWLPALPPFLVALVVTAGSVPLARWLSFRVGVVDVPGGRHRHDQPTALLGGLALLLGFALAIGLFGRGIGDWAELVGIAVAVVVLFALDDREGLPAWTKLVLQTAGALVVAWGFGITITTVHLPGVVWTLGWLAIPLTVVWLVGMQNSINLLDGVDGLAAGVVGIVAAILMVAAVDRLGRNPGQPEVIMLSAALIGACLGFLAFNFAPARIFMGDSGAHLLGLLIGIISIVGVAKTTAVLALFVPVVALGLPIADTALAIGRRRRAGRSVATADVHHLHYRLLALGLSPRETAVAFYLVTAILGCLGLAIFGHRKILAVALVLLGVALVLLLVRVRRRQPAGLAALVRGRPLADPPRPVGPPARPRGAEPSDGPRPQPEPVDIGRPRP